MRKLRVWGGNAILGDDVERLGLPPSPHRQYRCLVAAATKKQARALAGVSAYQFDGWWTETGNAVELSVAVEEGVWYAPLDGARKASDYKRDR